MGLRESELEEEEPGLSSRCQARETPRWRGSLMWCALWATMEISVTRRHHSSVYTCVHVCAYLSKGSGNLLCSFNLILPVILQASPIYFLDRKDKTQKRQWTGQVTQQVRTEPRLGPTAASLAAQCVSLFPALPSPILPPKGLGQQGN